MKAIVCVGTSASGKSTFAESLVKSDATWREINRDSVRFDIILNHERDWSKYKFNKTNEQRVTEICNSLIEHNAHVGYNIIVSDTNLNARYRDALVNKLEGFGYEVEIKVFDVDLEEAYRRDKLRPNSVGCEVILKQWLQYQEYKRFKKYEPYDIFLPVCAVIDIDGTVADSKGIRSSFDWEKVDQDKPIQEVMDIVDGLYLRGYKIVFLSGRDGSCFDKTKKWLEIYFNFPIELHMRQAGDTRKDHTIKSELFWKHVAPNYLCKMVIDDRKQVIENLWEPLGIKVIDVGHLYERF